MKILLSLVGMLTALSIHAGTPDTFHDNHVTAGYQLATGSGTPDGLFVAGSYGLTDDIYVAGSFDTLRTRDARLRTLSARAGYRWNPEPHLDLYAEAGLASINAELSIFGPTISDSDLGLWLEGGVGTALSPDIEGHTGLRLLTGDYDEQLFFVHGVYHISTPWSATVELARMFEAAEFRLQFGVRYNL